MNGIIHTDLCVIGAGSGGLSVAAGAAQMGADVVLVEKGEMGGDCLNAGCVPSKALIAAAHSAQAARAGARFGICAGEPRVDFSKVYDHIHHTIAAIAPNDSVERFEGLGVRVLKSEGRFTGPRELIAGGARVRARRYVIATGSTAAVPPIPGLDSVEFLTNETIFDLKERPTHLIVIGGGPIGIELAQAYRRLGSKVSVVEMLSILGKDDPDAVAVIRARLAAEGVELHEGTALSAVEQDGGDVVVSMEKDGVTFRVRGSHLLVAAGRRPVINALDLTAAGVAHSKTGIQVDRRLRTSNKRIFAIGDVIGGYQFTHMAGYHAGIVIKNALFRLPAKVGTGAVPWVTYTDPELAHVGLTEAAARGQDANIRVLVHRFDDNDRARTELETEGFIKVMVGPRGRVVGATIVGAHAGELILPWVLVLNEGLGIGAIANLIAPYPTLGEISKRAAGSYYTPALFGERTRKLVRFLAKLP
ncbi:MAG: FAD-dependent oxidoreductase [Rhodospirillales bacterium]|nr:FAD-dependent oxidoreductase [Rhodospirillales bacterium]